MEGQTIEDSRCHGVGGRLRHYNLWTVSNGDYSTNMGVGYEMKIINDPSENFWSKQLWFALATRSQIPDAPSPEEWQPKQPRLSGKTKLGKLWLTVCVSLLEIELNAISAGDQTTGYQEQSCIAQYHCRTGARWCHIR